MHVTLSHISLKNKYYALKLAATILWSLDSIVEFHALFIFFLNCLTLKTIYTKFLWNCVIKNKNVGEVFIFQNTLQNKMNN